MVPAEISGTIVDSYPVSTAEYKKCEIDENRVINFSICRPKYDFLRTPQNRTSCNYFSTENRIEHKHIADLFF